MSTKEDRRKIVENSDAWIAASNEGLEYWWINHHVGGTTSFLASSLEDAGFTVDENGNPKTDVRGNTVANYSREPLDPGNDKHVSLVGEWYGEPIE